MPTHLYLAPAASGKTAYLVARELAHGLRAGCPRRHRARRNAVPHYAWGAGHSVTSKTLILDPARRILLECK